MRHIVQGTKNHDYRKSLLKQTVQKFWFYTLAPVSAFQYIARIGRGPEPGGVPNEGGLENADFDNGLKKSNFGYQVQDFWKLPAPITLVQQSKKATSKSRQGRTHGHLRKSD